MAAVTILDIIKGKMKSMNISQSKLAEGILDKSHFSRILKGKSAPHYSTLKLVFERLGLDISIFADFCIDKKTAEHEDIKAGLDSKIRLEKYDEAKLLINKLDKDTIFLESKVNKQHLLSCKAAMAIEMGECSSTILPILEEAIKISIPYFKEENLDRYLLAKVDMEIVNMMAILYNNDNERGKAIQLLKKLKENFDRRFLDTQSKGGQYTLIIYNLTKYLGMAGQYKEAINLCEDGIDTCIETGIMTNLPSLAFNKAACLLELGDEDTAAALFTQVYYSAALQKDFGLAKTTKKYALDKLGIKL